MVEVAVAHTMVAVSLATAEDAAAVVSVVAVAIIVVVKMAA